LTCKDQGVQRTFHFTFILIGNYTKSTGIESPLRGLSADERPVKSLHTVMFCDDHRTLYATVSAQSAIWARHSSNTYIRLIWLFYDNQPLQMTPLLLDTDRSVFSTFVKHRKCHSYTRQLQTLSCHHGLSALTALLTDLLQHMLYHTVKWCSIECTPCTHSHIQPHTHTSCWEMHQPSIIK